MGEIPRTSDVSRPEETSPVVGTTPLDDVSHREENNLRIKMLDQIVTCLEMKKPSWQKARILHLSTQLEDSMFNSKETLAEYGDVSTLPAKINQHCLLLATRKTTATTSKTAAPGNAGVVCSFAATPVTRGPPVYTGTPFKTHIGGPGGGLGRTSNGSTFVLEPPSEPSRFSQPAPRGPAAGEATPRALGYVWIGSGHKLDDGAGGHNGGAGLRGMPGGGSNGYGNTGSSVLLPPASSSSMTAADAPHSSSSHGETTEDDMNDDSVDGDGEGDGDGDDFAKYGERRDAPKHVAATAVPSATLSGTHDAVSLAHAAANANTLVQRDQGEGEGHEDQDQDQDHDEITEQAHVEAVIAAASLGEDTAWKHGVQGAGAGVRQFLEGGAQPQGRQHPKATEAEVRQHALRLLQCRLLLLTHASTCSKDDGSCQLAPLCDSVRQLLQHLPSCRDEKSCKFPHCKSSKAVLQHKRLCTDSACRLCCSVKDISQKCFWANARHLHKRRLEESHELRRKKRQSEGKAVAPPRKVPADKNKGRESCSGLDEAGNDLGDITLGFFLRQAKAVKARKIGKAPENGGDKGLTASASSSSTVAYPARAHAGTTDPVAGSKRGHDGVAKGGGSAPQETGSSPSSAGRTHAQMQRQRQTRGVGAPTPTSALRTFPSPVSSPRLRRSSSSSVSWSALLSQELAPSRGSRSPRAQDSATVEMEVDAPAAEGTPAAKAVAVATEAQAEDVSGGGAEASSVGAAWGGNGGGGGRQHGGKEPAELAGGLTVVIPPVGSGAVVGHLRSPSEVMLDDIAESLADTTRKPSFARMQSVQAFLDDHVELRASASFGDVSAMVEHWMSLEDNDDADNFEDESGMEGFTF